MSDTSSGIGFIAAQDTEEVARLIKLLGVEDAYPVTDILLALSCNPEPVIWYASEDLGSIQRIMSALNVRRGVISFNGKITHAGFNKDWMCKTLSKPVDKPAEPMKDIPTEFEKDDPFESLGYRR